MTIKLVLPDDTIMLYAVVIKGKTEKDIASGMIGFTPENGKRYDLNEESE